MKRHAIILISILTVVGMVTGVFAGIRRAAPQMQIQFNKRDLPEHGVHIITPVDSSFEETALKYFKDKSPETLKPFSVFVRNSGPKTVVAYALTWQFMKTNGKVISQSIGYSEPGILMGDEIPKDQSFKHTTAIEPGNVRCFSWNSQIEQDTTETSHRKSEGTQTDNSNAIRAMLVSELSQATDITVSLEGVVFDDGAFVGPNETFFLQIQAVVNAKVDLLREIAMAEEQGQIDQALESITAKSLGPEVVLATEFSPENYYGYFKKLYATEIANMKGSYKRARPILKKK